MSSLFYGAVLFSTSSHGCSWLQGEIHMSDDAIHDILEQTESDPAFQGLFDLFDYSNQPLVLAFALAWWNSSVTDCCIVCDSR